MARRRAPNTLQMPLPPRRQCCSVSFHFLVKVRYSRLLSCSRFSICCCCGFRGARSTMACSSTCSTSSVCSHEPKESRSPYTTSALCTVCMAQLRTPAAVARVSAYLRNNSAK